MHDMSTPITQHWLHYKYMLEPFELFHNISSTMSFKHLPVFLVSAILLITSNFIKNLERHLANQGLRMNGIKIY